MKQLFILFTASILILVSCKKKEDDTPFSGTITVENPKEGIIISGGTTFPITATISGNKTLFGFDLTVYNTTDQSVVYTLTETGKAKTYTINTFANHTLTSSTPLKLVLTVYKGNGNGNGNGETMTKEVNFSFQP